MLRAVAGQGSAWPALTWANRRQPTRPGHLYQAVGNAAHAVSHGRAARLLPQSRGGLMLYNWAAENPIAWPASPAFIPSATCAVSRAGTGLRRLRPHGAELRAHLAEHNPIDRLAPLAKVNVPILHVHGDADRVVPWSPTPPNLSGVTRLGRHGTSNCHPAPRPSGKRPVLPLSRIGRFRPFQPRP